MDHRRRGSLCQRLNASRILVVDDVRHKDVIDHLLATDALSRDDQERIEHEVTSRDKTRKMLDLLLQNGDSAVESFLEALEETYPDVRRGILRGSQPRDPRINVASTANHSTSSFEVESYDETDGPFASEISESFRPSVPIPMKITKGIC